MNNFVGLSKIGLVRQRNEDRFFIDGPICAVTDGMGWCALKVRPAIPPPLLQTEEA